MKEHLLYMEISPQTRESRLNTLPAVLIELANQVRKPAFCIGEKHKKGKGKGHLFNVGSLRKSPPGMDGTTYFQ